MIYPSVSGGVGPRLIRKHRAHSQKKGNSTSERGSDGTNVRNVASAECQLAFHLFSCTGEGEHFEASRHEGTVCGAGGSVAAEAECLANYIDSLTRLIDQIIFGVLSIFFP